MLKDKIYVVVFLLLLTCNGNLIAQNWQDLEPLRSQRSDVEKILGEPKKFFETFGSYSTEFGKFSVWYSSGGCAEKKEGAQYVIDKGLMTSVLILLDRMIPLSEFMPDTSNYEKSGPTSIGRSYYVSEDGSKMFGTIHKKEGEFLYMIRVGPTDEQEKKYGCKAT